jgi:hypothetical protein
LHSWPCTLDPKVLQSTPWPLSFIAPNLFGPYLTPPGEGQVIWQQNFA